LKVKTDLDVFGIIYKFFSYNYASSSQVGIIDWENYNVHQSKVKYLESTLAKFIMEKSNFYVFPNYYKCVMNKIGIDYTYQRKQKPFFKKNKIRKSSCTPLITYLFFMRK